MSNEKPVRTLVTIVMDVLVAVAIAETFRLIVRFFGSISEMGWAEALVAITKPVTLPLGIESIKTPYGGIFEVNAALTIVALLLVEYVLSQVRVRS